MENFTNSWIPDSEQDDYYDEDYDERIVVYQNFYERQIIAALFIVATLIGTIGNCFVIVAVALSKKLRTTTNVFVVNLAVCDMLTSMVMPWQAVALLGGDSWPIPEAPWLCQMVGFVTIITFGGSVNSLSLIAINRWIGITKSRLTTRRVYSKRKLAGMVMFAWCIPVCCALTPVLTDFGELGYEKLYSTCTWDRDNLYSFYFNILITAAYYPIQLILIVLSYFCIFCYVRETSRKMARADTPSEPSSVSAKVSGTSGHRAMKRKLWKRQLAVTKNLLYIVLAYVVCLTPYFTVIIVSADWSYRLTPWGGMILFCNSCINPIIYATSHPDFKEAFGYMVRCRKIPRGGTSQKYRSTTTSTTSVKTQ
ncbi:octopamine receptor 1-like [Asterias rubens]|uniref:octopamine receptor 1-like n=1 Tax=Asterias rubens TaxID=7604 RepID=UPI0014558D66|nr:octopamine receptor 1-like [Asterias rubens]